MDSLITGDSVIPEWLAAPLLCISSLCLDTTNACPGSDLINAGGCCCMAPPQWSRFGDVTGISLELLELHCDVMMVGLEVILGTRLPPMPSPGNIHC